MCVLWVGMEVENDVEIERDCLLDHLIEELNALAGFPGTVARKDDGIDGNTDMIETELVDVLEVCRRGVCAELRKRVVAALR